MNKFFESDNEMNAPSGDAYQAHAADLWYEVLEDSHDKSASRPSLVEYVQLQMEAVKTLDAARRLKGNEYEIPLAFDEQTGRNIAYGMLAVLAACEWINEREEPVLYQMFRLAAIITTSGSSEDTWQKLSELSQQL